MMHIVLIALSSAATLGAMAIDFVFGLIKAKKRGEARTSTGYKKTASKAQKYFSPFMVLVFIDLICCVVIPFPVFSMFWAAYCVFCEFKSVREKSWQKAELRKLNSEISLLELTFSQNLMHETNNTFVTVDKLEELEGLPEANIEPAAKMAEENGQKGKWMFNMQRPSCNPVLQYCKNRELRHRVYDAYYLSLIHI